MKRIVAGVVLAFSLIVPSVSLAQSPTKAHIKQYKEDYWAVRHLDGAQAAGCNLIGWKGSCHHKVTDAMIVRSDATLLLILHPAPPPTTSAASAAPVSSTYVAPAGGLTATVPLSTTTYSSAGGLANVPGVPSSFAACVAFRESTNGTLSSNIYGILGPGGQGSVAQQKAAFSQMYAARGTQPWAPYDGC